MQQHKHAFHVERHGRFLQLKVLCIVFLLIFLGLMFSACNSNVSSNTPPKTSTNITPQATTISKTLSTPQSITSSQTTGMQTAKTYPVKVFFSKAPESYNDFSAVFSVDRTSPTSGVATFAIQQLIAGPTPSESSSGYFSELNKIMSGPSVCSNAASTGSSDFTLTLDKKGSADEQGTATLKFCRVLSSPGVGTDARIQSEINATLKQFASIKKVVILTKDGHCFGDESGRDFCLR